MKEEMRQSSSPCASSKKVESPCLLPPTPLRPPLLPPSPSFMSAVKWQHSGARIKHSSTPIKVNASLLKARQDKVADAQVMVALPHLCCACYSGQTVVSLNATENRVGRFEGKKNTKTTRCFTVRFYYK